MAGILDSVLLSRDYLSRLQVDKLEFGSLEGTELHMMMMMMHFVIHGVLPLNN